MFKLIFMVNNGDMMDWRCEAKSNSQTNLPEVKLDRDFTEPPVQIYSSHP